MKLSSPDMFLSCRFTPSSNRAGWTACEFLVPARALSSFSTMGSAAIDKICELNAIFYSTLPKDFELLNFLLRCFLPDRCLSTTHPMLSEVIRKVSRHRTRSQHRSTSFYFHGANCIVGSILLPAVFYIIQTKHLSHRAGSKSFIYLHSLRSSSFSF